MSKNALSWLHLTDFHFGLEGQNFLWPNLRAPFLFDLEELHRKTGPWQIVFFTGDIVQKGLATEFEQMQREVLDKLWEKLKELGSGDAILMAVPGNHDLIRPDPRIDDPAIDALLDCDRFGGISEKFWRNPTSSYRTAIEKVFLPYSQWWEGHSKNLSEFTKGMLPGDFSCTFTSKGGQKIGIVGLNTAFLQLKGGDYRGKLAWHISQLNAVCGGAIDHWVSNHSVRILLTHHGIDWLSADAQALGETEIAPANRFTLHMFGHMHEPSIKYIRTGGAASATRLLQGCSAFGMESYGDPTTTNRIHGYAAGQIKFDEDGASLKLWPRIATDKPKGNGWRYVADVNNAMLCSDEGTSPELLATYKRASRGPSSFNPEFIPSPPNFYAYPPYIGSHNFVGRQAQLDVLDDWASPADVHSIFLFDAIGGTGKSILTWEWATKYSSKVRSDWAGSFWYSFYEKGATMLDFCRRALAYIYGKPVSSLKRKNTAELTIELALQLKANPWLIILDGLERVLVSYHRFDAPQVQDEDAGKTDEIASRNPCATIRPEDDDLLWTLAGVSPSKILVSTRLIPRVLLNNSNQTIPGVRRTTLSGLRPQDAEDLLRSCGIRGTSADIQSYLTAHCDCHPLVIGVLAGLINDYLPDRGNFDAWATAVDGGMKLNLAKLNLVQKRNNILHAAIAALDGHSRQLLSTISLLYGSIDYHTLCALNPLLPPLPEAAQKPPKIKKNAEWKKIPLPERTRAEELYETLLRKHEEYIQATKKRPEEMRAVAGDLSRIVKNLELRGLLQYDPSSQRYDLHPVVRGISAGGLKIEEKNQYGQLVVDHFSLKAVDPYGQAESLEDFEEAKSIIKTFFQMGRMDRAFSFLNRNSALIESLSRRFEADSEILEIVRPFFEGGWGEMPSSIPGISLAKRAAISLRRIGALPESVEVSKTIFRTVLAKPELGANELFSQLVTFSSTLGEQNLLAVEDRMMLYAERLLPFIDAFYSNTFYLARFRQLSRLGKWAEAEQCREKLLAPSTDIAAHHHVVHLYQRGRLTEEDLESAERLACSSQSALGIRNLITLRGYWLYEKGKYLPAKESLEDALIRARKAGKQDKRTEICLAIVNFKLDKLDDPRQIAAQLSAEADDSCHRFLAELWLSIGERREATLRAAAAYKWACADGEPFVRRSELLKARELLVSLGCEVPEMINYARQEGIRYEFENAIEQAIDRFLERRRTRIGKLAHNR